MTTKPRTIQLTEEDEDWLCKPQPIAERVAARIAKADDWTKKGEVWLIGVDYADGEKHTWGIFEKDGKFGVEIDMPKGTFQRKRPFDNLEKAQRYASRFVDKPNGNQLLADVLDKDFKEVNGRKHVSPLN